MMRAVPRAAAELARDMRTPRRTRSGRRNRGWSDIVDELRRRGFTGFDVADLQHAVSALPLEAHALAPLTPDLLSRLEASWREGWAADFPAEPWPGLEEAKRRLRTHATTRPVGG